MGQLKNAPAEIMERVAFQIADIILMNVGTGGDVSVKTDGNTIHVEQATKPTDTSEGMFISFDIVINSVKMR